MPAPARESVACDLCGQDDAALLVTKNGFRVVRCRGCSLVYVNPRLKMTGLTELYETDTFFDHQVTRAADESWKPEAEARVAILNKLYPSRGKLLDVGCSAGWFMGVAEAAGWDVLGLDVSAAAVAHAKQRGYAAKVATLDAHDLAPASFDVVTMFDSIEHMPTPLGALRAAHALLKPGGIVMITTPNIDGIFPRLTYQLFGRTFGGWEHPGPPGHIYQFGKKTLAAALDRACFEVVFEKTEAIDLQHTVGALEEVVMDVLKGRTKRAAEETGDDAAPPPPKQAPAKDPKVRLLRRALRRTVRTAAWALTGGVAATAPLVGGGDSLIVVARRA